MPILTTALRTATPCALILLLSLALVPGCSEDGGTGPSDDPVPTSDVVVFERHRDSQTGAGVPVLTESGSGFDAREVDSPAVVFDAGRPNGDVYLLYYEASDGGGISSIGLVSSARADFSTLSIGRTAVLSVGAAGSAYAAGATDPAVVVEPPAAGQRYRMWFEGRGGSGGEVSTILTAVSDDGVTWNDVRVCAGLTPSYADVRIADPCVLVDGGLYRMWFEAQGAGLGLGAIGYAESTDGIVWTLRDATGATGDAAGPVFTARGGSAFDAVGVHSPSVTFDPTAEAAAAWQLWYEASDVTGSTQNSLGMATSSDGLAWTRLPDPVLTPASDSLVPLPFDSGDLEHPSVLVDASVSPGVTGHYLLWYTGDGESNLSPNRIGLARGRLESPGQLRVGP